jgi:site-specific recombinase XerD
LDLIGIYWYYYSHYHRHYMKISVIIRKDQPDKEGLCKLAIRINKGNKRTLIATEYKVRPAQFKKGKVINHNDAQYINRQLANLLYEYEEKSERLKVVTFKTFTDSFIIQHEKTGTRGKGTIRYYKSQAKKFLKFSDDLPLTKITPDMIKSYIVFMRTLGNDNNTIWSSLKFIKMVFNDAKREGMVRSSPFEKMPSFAYKQTTRAFLTGEEVKKIYQLKIETANPLYNIQKWFLIQCYTGLRAGDLKQLNREKIINENRIILDTGKTGSLVSIPLSEEVKKLISEVRPFNITLEDYNRQLKSLAVTAGITKHLTSHMGRHAAAMRMAELGISKEVASKVLGHKKSATTDIYYKIQDERVNSEMAKFNF